MYIVTPVELKRIRVFLSASSELSYGCRLTVCHENWHWWIADTHSLCTFEMRQVLLPRSPRSALLTGASCYNCMDLLACVKKCAVGKTALVALDEDAMVWHDADGHELCRTKKVDPMVLAHRVKFSDTSTSSDFCTSSVELTADLSNVNVFSGLSAWSMTSGGLRIHAEGAYGSIEITKAITNSAIDRPRLLVASKMLKTTMVAFNKTPLCSITWPRTRSEPLVVRNDHHRCCLADLRAINDELAANVFE